MLPLPDANVLNRSEKLAAQVRQQIDHAGGHISFARFMQLALYTPILGYYTNLNTPFGPRGDFITAPHISPLFSQTIARQFQQILKAIPNSSILEIGAGSGVFAQDVLMELERLDSLPQQYFILELSPSLQAQQQKLLRETCPQLIDKIIWLEQLPSAFHGVIFANEVMDALPFHCFKIEADGIKERSVVYQEKQFRWHLTLPSEEMLQLQTEFQMSEGYESEINLSLRQWIKDLATCLSSGVILLFDYGYGRRDYYHPDRAAGTLMCYFQHQRHSDPFINIGLQDITAHVDFTTVAESAIAADLSLVGYTTQAAFLLACGILELCEKIKGVEYHVAAQAIKKLTLPSEMGEAIKVMALTKNFDLNLLGFSLFDRRIDL